MGKKFIVEDDKKKELLSEIKQLMKIPGPLMPILHEAQRIFSCIPIEVQKIISKETDVSIADRKSVV